MENKVDSLYREILEIFSDDDFSQIILPIDLQTKFNVLLKFGTPHQRQEIAHIYACCIFQGKIVELDHESAFILLDQYHNKKQILPDCVCQRLVLSIQKLSFEQAVKYLLWAFDLKYYDAIRDIGEIYCSGTIFKANPLAYCDLMYKLTLQVLPLSDKKFSSIIFHWLRQITINNEQIFEASIEALSYAKRSENWTNHHTELLEALMINHAKLHYGDVIVRINDQLEIVDEVVLSENLHSSISPSTI